MRKVKSNRNDRMMFRERKAPQGIIRIESYGICAQLWKKGSKFPNTAEWATADIPESKRSYEEMALLMDEITKTINVHLQSLETTARKQE